MTIGRLSIHAPYWGLEYNVGICGCKILSTPVGTFTWHDKRCTCGKCKNYVCNCPMSEEEFKEMVINSGVPEKEFAKEFDIAISTVRRWKTGVSCPLPGMRKIVKKFIDEKKNENS